MVKGSEQNKSSVDKDIIINVPFEGKNKEILESDRNSSIKLNEVFNSERQASSIFRLTFNVNFFYENNIIGTMDQNSGHVPFLNEIYRVNPSYTNNIWSGYPQHQEFNFIREDVNTQQFSFQPKSASTYNWLFYITYPFERITNFNLRYINGPIDETWNVGSGLLGTVNRIIVDGQAIIRIETPFDHGIGENEFLEITGVNDPYEFMFPGFNDNVYEVHYLGDGTFDSEKRVINILDIGYPQTLFQGATCLIKRVMNKENRSETTSKYYIRNHKVLTFLDDVTNVYNAFQENPFKNEKHFEYGALTYDGQEKVKMRNNTRSYNISNNKDIDVSGLLDNNGKPLTEFFITIINKGYGGWFHGVDNPTNDLVLPSSIKKGWEFNIGNGTSNDWWRTTNSGSDSGLESEWYINGGNRFYYTKSLETGDTLMGDICEYNDYEQKERVVSKYINKMRYNQSYFNVNVNPNIYMNNNLPGFYYQPHFEVKIRDFSSYIETSKNSLISSYEPLNNFSGTISEDIPPYSYFSLFDNSWRWRDIYTYGYVDSEGNGVDNPFVNNSHYVTSFINFRLFSDIESYVPYDNYIENPSIDECE